MTTLTAEITAAALELANGGRWRTALALLDAAWAETGTMADPARERIALVAAEVALDEDWWAGTDNAGERIAAAEKAGAYGWEWDFLRLRKDYLQLIHPAGGRFQPGPAGKDPDVVAEVERRGERLRATAPGPVEAGWADFYRGVIADNLRADRAAAPAFYKAALAAGDGRDDLLAREALRHLGDHDHDNGDHAAALDRWRRATALGARAGRVTGTLSQQLLLAVLARDAGDEAGAVALATEVARWAEALGATRIRDNAAGFLSGVDPTAGPPSVKER